MKTLKLFLSAVCSVLLIGSIVASASNEKIPVENFTIFSYCPETGDEEYIECDTSFVADQINNGATHISTPSYFGESAITQGNIGNEVSPNAVIGFDFRYQIREPASAQNRSVCMIETHWNNTTGYATGCLIGPNKVLTAAHVVHNLKEGGKANEIRVYPGYDSSTNPTYGYYLVKTVNTTDAWKVYENPNDDWAVLILTDSQHRETTVGNTLGYWGMNYISSGSLNGVSVYVTGYPGDKPKGTMWCCGGAISTTTNQKIYYDCDTFEGESGAPVTNSSRQIVGIHSGAYMTNGVATENWGVRITAALMSTIKKFS